MIASYYDTSKEEYDKNIKLVEKEEWEMEMEDRNHKMSLNAFTNKFKHIEYDHDIFVTKTLVDNAERAVKEEENIRAQRENQYMDKKSENKKTIKEEADANRENIDKKKDILEKRYSQKKEALDERLQSINMKYD
jgi:hypothetical protein